MAVGWAVAWMRMAGSEQSYRYKQRLPRTMPIRHSPVGTSASQQADSRPVRRV